MFRDKDQLALRVKNVNARYSAFQALTDHGIEIPDESTSYQILCPFHGDKNKPSARYYSNSGLNSSHFYCFKCKSRMDSVALYAKFQGIKFYDALTSLEKKYNIKVEESTPSFDIAPSDRDSGYKSNAWSDMPRMWEIVENKLIRNRFKCTFNEYINLCRLLDNVIFDFNKTGIGTQDMVTALHKASAKIDDLVTFEI